jgi:hypothetical protein
MRIIVISWSFTWLSKPRDIFSRPKEDYLKSERFVMVGDFELTRCLYLTMVNNLGGICYPGMVVLP